MRLENKMENTVLETLVNNVRVGSLDRILKQHSKR